MNSAVGVHVSSNLKEKIIGGQYVDLGSLFSTQVDGNMESNLSLNASGELVLKQSKQKQNSLDTIESWTDVFIIFSVIYLSAH